MTDRPERFGRRELLYTMGAAGLALLAGCADDGMDDDDGEADDETDDEEMDDGEADDGTDDEEMDDGETDDGETDDETEADDDDDDADPESGARLRDVIAFEPQYVMEFESADGMGTWTFHEGDWYLEGELDGQSTEMYSIQTDTGTDTYIVEGGQCFKMSVEMDQDDVFDPEDPDEDDEEYVSSGTTTIDGQEVYIFDIEDGTYYVSVDSGYPVRFEGEDGDVVDFHSWGATDPISPPEMECVEP